MVDFTLDPAPPNPASQPFVLDPVPSGGIVMDGPRPGIVSSFLTNLTKSAAKSLANVGSAPTAFTDKTGPQAPLTPEEQLAAGPMQWTNPAAYAAKLGAGIGGAGPTIGGAVAGTLAGEAIEPAGGGFVGGPAGAFVGSVVQELAPAYQAARAQGLSHEQAVDQAWKSASVSGATGALMTIAPIFKLFGTTVEGALKKPVSEFLAQTFAIQPAIGTGGAAVQTAVTGQPAMTPEQLAETYLTNVGAGAAMAGAHKFVIDPALARARALAATGAPEGTGAPLSPEAPVIPEGVPSRPAAAPTGPLPPMEPGAIVGVRSPDGPIRAQIASIGDGLVHWTAPDGTPRVDDLAAFQRDVVPAPPPTVPAPPPVSPAGPETAAPPSFAEQFVRGPEPVAPARPAAAAPVVPRDAPAPVEVPPAHVPDTLYVNRPVLNAQELHDWAVAHGIPNVVPPEEMHVTQVHSDTPVDIKPLAEPVTATAAEKGIGPLGDKGAVVLHLDSPDLQARFAEAQKAGASHDYPAFQPHVTLSYDASNADLAKAGTPPFPIELGAEVHAPIDENAGARNQAQAAAAPEFKLDAPVAEPTPAPRARAAEKPDQTLLQFLRSKGGVQDEGGELRGMDLNRPQYGVGRAAIIRKGGMDWDEAVLQAQQAGYIGGGAGLGDQVGPETTQGGKQELVDRISREAAGEKQYPIGGIKPTAERDLGAEADAREIEAMALERRALLSDLASLGETDIYHLDNDALKDRLDERLGMTGMDNVEDARRAIEAEEGTLNRLLSADAAVKAAITAEDTKGDFNARKPAGPGDTALGDAAQGTPQAPARAAAEVAQPAAGGDQAPGTVAQGGARAPTVKSAEELARDEWVQRHEALEANATALAESGQPVRLVRAKDGHQALAGPDLGKPGRFQITTFDKDGPIGHVEYQTLAEAVLHGLQDGYVGQTKAPIVENIQTVEGPRPHYVLPGMEQSAVQAQAARDARGMTPNVEQKPPNEGLFAPVETSTQQVIPGVSGEATAKAVDPGAVATGVKQAGKAFGDMLRDESGAVPRREKLLTDAERMAAQLEASKPDSLRGISMIAQYTGLAQSIAEKDPLGAAYLSSRENRTAARHSFQSDAQQSGGAWLRAPEATQTKINKVLEYQTMTNREIGDTGRPVVVHYDPARDFPGRPNPLQIIKPGETVRLNAAESKMFHDINDFMGRAWKQHAEADARKFGYSGQFLRTGADGKLDFDMAGIQNAIDTAPDRGVRLAAERAMGFATEAQNNARKGYFPLMRYGDWTITVTPKVPKSGTGHALRDEGWFAKVDSKGPFESLTSAAVGHDLSGTPKRVAQEMARLKQRFPDKDYNMIARRQDPKTAELVDLAMVNRVLADTKLTDPQTGERLADEVIGKLYDQAKAGYRQPREGIPGYSTDFARAYSDYARQWSTVTAEKLHGDGIRSAYDATQAGPDKRAASYWKNYAAYNDNPQPWIYGAMKRVGFLNWLWGSPSSAAIQLTQTPLLTGTQAGLLVGHPRAQYMAGTLLTRAMAAVRPSGKGFALDIKDMGGLTARERAALTVADKEGRLQPVLPTDFAGGQFSPEMRRRFAPAVRVYDIGASMFNTADRANRITAWLTAYRAAQMPGVADKAARIYRNDALYREQVGPKMDPAKFANWFTNETQFLSGREGSSPLMRGPGSVAFQFQHYNSNMLRVMRKNLVKMGPEGKAAFAVMLTGLTLGAGLGGLPFVNDAERLANEVGKWINNDIDPRLDAKFREMIADSGFAQMAASFFGTDPMHVAEATTEGLSRSVLGLDLGRRIGLGNILPDSTDLFTAVPFIDATVGKAMEVAKRLKDNQTFGAAAALAPAALANPIKAFGSWPNEGINPQAGGVPYFKASQVTPGMQAARAIGFQPASVARRQEFMADQNAIKFATDAAQKQLVKSVADAYGRAVDFSQQGNQAASQYWTQQAEQMLRDNAARLADPNIEAWQQIPQPMANALKNRISAYLMEPGTLTKGTNKMKVPELLNSPYLSQ